MKVAVIGAGWAGLSAAVLATQAGHKTTVFEASKSIGGRARTLNCHLPNDAELTLDNGQHILIGAYTQTLALMATVGVDTQATLLRCPLTLRFPDGQGLCLPNWPAPFDAMAGIVRARGWRTGDKLSLLRAATTWYVEGFRCDPAASVAQLCQRVSPRVMAELIEPLCVSALNTPAPRASAQVFLRVLQDALFGAAGASNLLLPRVDLGRCFPQAAARWLHDHGSPLHLNARVTPRYLGGPQPWQLQDQRFDAVILATDASNSALALADIGSTAPESIANRVRQWVAQTRALQFESIATVYAWGRGACLQHPMMALRSRPNEPAQFAFDRGALSGLPAHQGLIALVVSASDDERQVLQDKVIAQAQNQLGLRLQAVQTVVEKRATFACTPGLVRPGTHIAPGLLACGDFVEGPYPATLEGAVRSAQQAVRAVAQPPLGE